MKACGNKIVMSRVQALGRPVCKHTFFVSLPSMLPNMSRQNAYDKMPNCNKQAFLRQVSRVAEIIRSPIFKACFLQDFVLLFSNLFLSFRYYSQISY